MNHNEGCLSMRNYIKCLFSLMLCVFYPISGMLITNQPKPQEQFLPKDCLKEVQWNCDLQSLGRLASTCKYIRKNFQVKNFSKEQFGLVEKCLYYYAPKTLLPSLSDTDMQQIQKILCGIINAHITSIDESIASVYKPIQEAYKDHFLEKLTLLNEDRIGFYFGKLPEQKPRYINSSECESNFENFLQGYGNSLTDDNIDAAYMDASFAVYDWNIERVKAVLNRYNQFPNHGNGLLESLCFLANGPILLDFLSIPERGIEYAQDSSGYTAIELARDACGDDALAAFLQQAINIEAKK